MIYTMQYREAVVLFSTVMTPPLTIPRFALKII